MLVTAAGTSPRADEVGNARRGRDRQRKGQLVRDRRQRGKDALYGERLCPEAAQHQREDLEGEVLCFDHDHSGGPRGGL